MPPPSHRKNAHNSKKKSKKNTDSTLAKKTPPVTPNASPHNEDTIKSLIAMIDMLEKRVLELEVVLEVTRNANITASSSTKLTIFSNRAITNATLALLSTALPQ